MKKIGRSDIIGQRGMTQIESVVLAMGYMFYPTGGVEAGIDGFLELRDVETGEVGKTTLGFTVRSESALISFATVSTTARVISRWPGTAVRRAISRGGRTRWSSSVVTNSQRKVSSPPAPGKGGKRFGWRLSLAGNPSAHFSIHRAVPSTVSALPTMPRRMRFGAPSIPESNGP
jgi:hypothetical protein